jgi:predicted small lipoprotein YifL
MSTKRLLSLLVAMILLLGIIAGCGTSKEPDKTDPADPGDKEVVDKDKEDEEEPSTSDREIITVSMNVMDAIVFKEV